MGWRRWLDQDDDDNAKHNDSEAEALEELEAHDHVDQHTRTRLAAGEMGRLESCQSMGASMPSSPACDGRAINWDLVQRSASIDGIEGLGELSTMSLGSVDRTRSTQCFAEKSRQSICSEESFCCDTRSAPSLPSLPLGYKTEGIGGSVDLMTVASEASTRSLGSEQSSMSWFEGPTNTLPPKSMPDNYNNSYHVPPSPGARSAEAQLEASTRAMESLLNSNNSDARAAAPKPPPAPPPGEAPGVRADKSE